MLTPVIGISARTRRLDTALGLGEVHYSIAADYVNAVVEAGGLPVVLPTVDPSKATAYISGLDGLIISGGNDVEPARYGAEVDGSVDPDPDRDQWEIALVAAARSAAAPILGICRGAQILNVALGGTLHQHIWDTRSDHPDLHRPGQILLEIGSHRIDLVPGSRIAAIYGSNTRRVNSWHHQALDVVGEGLEVTARAPDGTIEAVESIDGLAIGVQWHPKRMDMADERPLFEALVKQAADVSAG